MHCKKALEHSNGDLKKAAEWLGEQGQLMAAKKASRATVHGAICVAIKPCKTSGILMEANVETDFCAKNETFLEFTGKLAHLALDLPKSQLTPEAIMNARMDRAPVNLRYVNTIAAIGENMSIRRFARVQPKGVGMVSAYIHNLIQGSTSHGLLATLVGLQADLDSMSDEQKQTLDNVGKRIAMHVTADRDNESPLLDQPFLQGEQTVGEWLELQSKAVGGSPIKVAQVESFKVGDGLESTETDFAAEVARQMEKAKKTA
jgi:elongation factor Ts